VAGVPGPVRQERRLERLLVHVLADRQRLREAPARREPGGVPPRRAAGPAPGLLAFDGDLAVGWCQLTPRVALPALDRARLLGRVDDVPVWSLSCFYVRRGYRGRGVMAALIAAAVKAAQRAGAPALEAYPIDTDQPTSTSNLYTGTASTFVRAGFRTVARRSPHRPVMRRDLEGRVGRLGGHSST